VFIQGIDEDCEIKLYSIDGRLVEHYNTNKDHFIQQQSSGLYLLQLVQKGKQETLKIFFN
jgi:hypothetical protein